MAYDDADMQGIALPQAVCWELLKYDVIPSIDIPCRVQLAGRRLGVPLVRARLRLVSSDDMGYSHIVQMYLHRGVSLGAFGPRFHVYCRADGAHDTLIHLRAVTDAAFESRAVTRALAWGYGIQWRLLSRVDRETTDEVQQAMHGAKVFFDDVEAYTFGQLTNEGLSSGFHRRGYGYIAELLRDRVRSKVAQDG